VFLKSQSFGKAYHNSKHKLYVYEIKPSTNRQHYLRRMDDAYFMQRALVEANAAFDKNEIPVGVVITVADKIIARGYNLTETLTDVTAHAEIQAITSASQYLGGKYLKECTMYVTLEPCVMCAGALYWAQLGKLVFAARDLQRGYQKAGVSLHPKTEVISGVMEDEASDLLLRFFNRLR
jgi:tRNA(adenine34) deaminase